MNLRYFAEGEGNANILCDSLLDPVPASVEYVSAQVMG